MPGGLRVGGAPGARVGLVLAGGSRVNEQTPVGVVTDFKPEATTFYEAFGFVPLEGVSEGTLHGDPTPMFLPGRTSLRALDSR